MIWDGAIKRRNRGVHGERLKVTWYSFISLLDDACFDNFINVYKGRWKDQQLFYHKVRQLLIQSATGVSKCDQGIINCWCDTTAVNTDAVYLCVPRKKNCAAPWRMFQKIKFRKLDFIALLLLLSMLFDFWVLCFAYLHKLKYRDYIFQTGIIYLNLSSGVILFGNWRSKQGRLLKNWSLLFFRWKGS